MKRSKFLIICIICYVIFFVMCKEILIFFVDLYSSSQKRIEYKNISNVTINKNNNVDNYLKSPSTNIYIKNVFSNLELVESSSESEHEYYDYYISEDGKHSLYIGISNTTINLLKEKSEDSLFYEFNHFPIYMSDNLIDYILSKNNIKNDTDLIKQVIKKRKNPTIFTSIVKIKEQYLYSFIESGTKLSENIIFIKGDYTGYIVVEDNNYYISLNYKEKNYYIRLHNIENITNENIVDLISTVKIKK